MEEAILMDYRYQPAVNDELDELGKYLKQGDRSELKFVSWVNDRSHAWLFFETPYEEYFCGVREDLVGQAMVYEGKEPIV
jgi:hypothetical protein